MTPYVLALLAFVLAWPVPIVLQKAKWPSRAPGAALVLWQAVGLSGGLSLVAAPLCWGLQPFGTGLLGATRELWNLWISQGAATVLLDPRWHPLGLPAITLGLLLFGHLSLMLFHTTFITFRERRRHKNYVALLAASLDGAQGKSPKHRSSTHSTLVLPVDHLLAYCLPGINQSITVVSQGLVRQLSQPQLSAVLAHESAHLTQRHDLLRLAFHAWQKAVPWLPATSVAVHEVTELTEILADRSTLVHHERQNLIAALSHTLLANKHAEDASETTTQQNHRPGARRISCLVNQPRPLSLGNILVVFASSLMLVIIPAIISIV